MPERDSGRVTHRSSIISKKDLWAPGNDDEVKEKGVGTGLLTYLPIDATLIAVLSSLVDAFSALLLRGNDGSSKIKLGSLLSAALHRVIRFHEPKRSGFAENRTRVRACEVDLRAL